MKETSMLGNRMLALLLAATAASCAPRDAARDRPGPDSTATRSTAPIVTDRDRYVLEPRTIGTVDAKVTSVVTTFTAPPDSTIYIMNCNGQVGWGLQRQENGEWVNAWLTTMNACLSEPIVVPAGTAWVDTMAIDSRTDIPQGHTTVTHGIPPGSYRLVLHGALTSFDMDSAGLGRQLSIERRISEPFEIVGGP
jgi:hypothetical protein